MRPTNQIDDPIWQDITDRDAEIARLQTVLDDEMYERRVMQGHSADCAARYVHGDQKCVCAVASTPFYL